MSQKLSPKIQKLLLEKNNFSIPVLPQHQDCLPAMTRIFEADKISKAQITVTYAPKCKMYECKVTSRIQNIAHQA